MQVNKCETIRSLSDETDRCRLRNEPRPPPSLRETVFIFFGGFLCLFIPAVFEKVAGYLIDSQIVGARPAGIRPTPGAANQPIVAGTASLIMLDTGAHGQPAHLPIEGLCQDFGERLCAKNKSAQRDKNQP